MTQESGFLALTLWETWMEFLPPGFSLGPALGHLGVNRWKEVPSVCGRLPLKKTSKTKATKRILRVHEGQVQWI